MHKKNKLGFCICFLKPRKNLHLLPNFHKIFAQMFKKVRTTFASRKKTYSIICKIAEKIKSKFAAC